MSELLLNKYVSICAFQYRTFIFYLFVTCIENHKHCGDICTSVTEAKVNTSLDQRVIFNLSTSSDQEQITFKDIDS